MRVFLVIILYLLLCVTTILMLNIVIGYMSIRANVQFLQYKQDYIGNPFWKAAFYIHVFSAGICLVAGFIQFSGSILREKKFLHRFLGRVYVFNILFVNFPVGMILAIYANGGIIGKSAFICLAILWFIFTLKGYFHAKSKRFKLHRNYMIRSYALTFSAVTLRFWHAFLVVTTDLNQETIYLIEAWAGFLPNLLIAEIILRYFTYEILVEDKSSLHR